MTNTSNPELRPTYSCEAHPLATLMPMMDDDAFAQHKADIAKHGVRDAITLYQGMILDGRNRYKAAKELGLTLSATNFKEFTGTPAEAEWRRWTGTHYAVMEEDALRADIYEFLANANSGKFDPTQRHVNAAIDGIKAYASGEGRLAEMGLA
jgi:hypothetical protein